MLLEGKVVEYIGAAFRKVSRCRIGIRWSCFLVDFHMWCRRDFREIGNLGKGLLLRKVIELLAKGAAFSGKGGRDIDG